MFTAFLVIGALSAALVKLVQKTSLVIASLSTEMLTLTSTGLVFAMMWVRHYIYTSRYDVE